MSGLGFLGLFMYSALYYYGIAVLSSQEACILNYLWPMMIVLFACLLLRETLTVKKAIAMVMSFAGIVVLTLGSGGGSSGNRLFGIIACVAAAVCYGLFSVLNKKHSLNQSVTMMWIWLTVAVCSTVSGLIIEAWQPITGWQWAGVAWLGIVVNAVAYLLWALALFRQNRKFGVSRAVSVHCALGAHPKRTDRLHCRRRLGADHRRDPAAKHPYKKEVKKWSEAPLTVIASSVHGVGYAGRS